MDLRGVPLAELQRRFGARGGKRVTRTVIAELRRDERAGARRLAEQLESRIEKLREERARLRELYRLEHGWGDRGSREIAGVDEVGMGPLAGPVIAAAVVLPHRPLIAGLDDSKRLSAAARAELASEIRARALDVSIGHASPSEIDRVNIYHAGLLAMRRAVAGLRRPPAGIASDARTIPDVAVPQRAIVAGDAKVACISAASIVAKVARDELMAALDRRYPGYGLASHKGYPTAEHIAALRALGPSPIHRRSFEPVRQAAQDRPCAREPGAGGRRPTQGLLFGARG